MMIKHCQLNLKHHCHVTFILSRRCLFQQKFWCISTKFIGNSMVWYMMCFFQEFSIWASIWIDDRNASSVAYNLVYFLSINHTWCIQWYSFATRLNAWNRSHLKRRHKNQIKIDIQIIFFFKKCSLQLDWWYLKRYHITCDKDVSCKVNALFFRRMRDKWLYLSFDMIEVKLMMMHVWCVCVELYNYFDLIMRRGFDSKRISSHQNMIFSSRYDDKSLIHVSLKFDVSWWVCISISILEDIDRIDRVLSLILYHFKYLQLIHSIIEMRSSKNSMI